MTAVAEPPAFTPERPMTTVVEHEAAPILVVDDQEAVRATVAEVLRSVGYTVVESCDGFDALAMLSTRPFEAMVLDLRMPRLSGAALLKAVPAPPPTVVLSAGELDDDDLEGIRAGVHAQLRKPVAPQRLIDAVRNAVQSEA